MPSFKSQAFNFIIRNRHLLRGKLHKEVFESEDAILPFREMCEKGTVRPSSLPAGISVREEVIEGINSEWITPNSAASEKIIMYVHGGGYVSGSCNDHRAFVAKFAEYCGYTCLVYEYGIAPENPYPAAIEDSVKVYRWLLTNGYKPENILIAGESAGGGLCLAILLKLKELNINQPIAAVAISPWTDLTCSSKSYKSKNKVSVAPLNSWFVFGKAYYGNNNPENPFISPLFGDLTGLPPIFINAGTDDELYDDGKRFYTKAKKSGVDATFRSGVGMIHCYPFFAPFFKEATEAMTEISEFVKKQLR